MHILPLLLLLPLIFSSPPPSFQDIIHDLDHFKLTFQSQSLDSLLNGSALVPPPPSPFVSSSSSFLPSHTPYLLYLKTTIRLIKNVEVKIIVVGNVMEYVLRACSLVNWAGNVWKIWKFLTCKNLDDNNERKHLT